MSLYASLVNARVNSYAARHSRGYIQTTDELHAWLTQVTKCMTSAGFPTTTTTSTGNDGNCR
jgi:hypothetical protein